MYNDIITPNVKLIDEKMIINERKTDASLKEWKQNINRKTLSISGAKQIGKTTSISKFKKT